MAFGSLGAKLVSKTSAQADEIAKVIDELPDDVARKLDDQAKASDEAKTADEELGLIPQSTPGRVGAGIAGVGAGAATYDLGTDFFETRQQEASARQTEAQGDLVDEILSDEKLNGKQKADALEQVARSGFFDPTTSSSSSDNGSGSGFLDDPLNMVIALVIIALVFKYVIGQDDDLAVPSVGGTRGN